MGQPTQICCQFKNRNGQLDGPCETCGNVRERHLLDNIQRFNRKERFFLLGWALGNSTLQLGKEFRVGLSAKIGTPVPQTAFVAMDYHLDCIYAALELTNARRNVYHNVPKMVEGTHQDIDLLVAWEAAEQAHIVMIEAKGVTPFSNEQLRSKVTRLKGFFGEKGDKLPRIKPHSILASHRESANIKTAGWPPWTLVNNRPIWVQMRLPSDLLTATRCHEDGVVGATGAYWKVVGLTKTAQAPPNRR